MQIVDTLLDALGVYPTIYSRPFICPHASCQLWVGMSRPTQWLEAGHHPPCKTGRRCTTISLALRHGSSINSRVCLHGLSETVHTSSLMMNRKR